MTLTLKLKRTSHSPTPKENGFNFSIPPSPSSSSDPSSLPSPPTSWLSARDMKLFGAQPLSSTSDIGVVKCRDCDKPVLRSFFTEHAANCASIRTGGTKLKAGIEVEDPRKGSKKRKASPSPNPSDPSLPPKKKSKTTINPKAPKGAPKGRLKGPVDYDKQCGVINDKNLPCSRSLTCKSHSMGAKRSVPRSKDYDILLLEWQRANNPNFVEPVKRETKAEKKEKREKEKAEKKRLAEEAALALGLDPSKKPSLPGITKKVGKKAAAAAAAAATRLAESMADEVQENLDELDSEAEVEALVEAVRIAREKGVTGVPLAVPCDAGTWFVQRRERARGCRALLMGALGGGGGMGGMVNGAGTGVPGFGGMGVVGGIGGMGIGGMGVGLGGRGSIGGGLGLGGRLA